MKKPRSSTQAPVVGGVPEVAQAALGRCPKALDAVTS
jgi:hypothetical protein